MNRVNAISKQVTGKRTPKVVSDSAEWFGFSELMGDKANHLRKRLRPVFESGIVKQILPHVENATFPEELVEILKAQRLGHYFLQGEFGNGADAWERATIITELARVDASAATLFLVQMKLLARTIELYGSQE